MVTRLKDVRIAARIPEQDDNTIERLVRDGRFINKSNFFRQAIKKLLEVEDDASE